MPLEHENSFDLLNKTCKGMIEGSAAYISDHVQKYRDCNSPVDRSRRKAELPLKNCTIPERKQVTLLVQTGHDNHNLALDLKQNGQFTEDLKCAVKY